MKRTYTHKPDGSRMIARYQSKCPRCKNSIAEGDTIYKRGTRYICKPCYTGTASVPTSDTSDTDTDTGSVNYDVDMDSPPIREPVFEDGWKVRRLNLPQLHVFLHLMGKPFKAHSPTKKVLQTEALALSEKNPVRATEVLDMVRHGKSAATTPVSMPPAEINVDALAQEVTGKIGFTHSALSNAVDKAVKEECKELYSNEANKHKRLEIKIGSAKRQLMKDILPAEFEKMLKLAAIRQNILLVGPSGSGKTFLAEKLAEAMDLPFGMISCSAGISESQLIGWLLPVGDNNKFSYVASSFVDAYENGGVFLLDELDAADAQILMIVNAALANGQMSIPQRYKNPMVKKHKDFVCVAAANTFGHGESEIYSGREMLDGATLDRFRAGVVFIEYSDRVEEFLCDSEVLEWGRNIRRAIADHKLEHIMSTRVLIDFSKQKAELGFTRKDWEDSYFVDWSKDERRYC